MPKKPSEGTVKVVDTVTLSMTAPPRKLVNPLSPVGLFMKVYEISTSSTVQPLTRGVSPSIDPVVARFFATFLIVGSLGIVDRAI